MLAWFLDEQEQRRSPKTAARYRDVVELLQHDLNGYAYLSLEELDARHLERLRNAAGDTPPIADKLAVHLGPLRTLPVDGRVRP